MRISTLLIAGALVSAACSDANSPTSKPSHLESLKIVSGASQTGTVATVLAESIAVVATDSNGSPAKGIGVAFGPSGIGVASPSSPVTDATGRVAVTWALDTVAGTDTLLVTALDPTASLDLITDTVYATATAGPAVNLIKRAGDQQTGTHGAALADSLTVWVTDQYRNPISGVVITWAVTGGGGTVHPGTSTTGATGVASTQWILGPTPGANTATAAATGLTTMTFQATGN